MRWWLNTDHGRFSVDNAVVNGLDFSALSPDIWMVQWVDGKGEIERQVDQDTNDNGLRENFIDIIPYCGYFQAFLLLGPRLTLVEEQKVQIDLIGEVFNSKRQAPFHYPIAAGDYYWDATDASLFASTVPALQNANAAINNMASAVNALAAAVNSLVTNINSTIVTGVNTNVVAVGNDVITKTNSQIVDITNGIVTSINSILTTLNTEVYGGFTGIASDVNTNITVVGNQTIAHLNNTVLGAVGGVTTPNAINNMLRKVSISGYTAIGLDGAIAANGYSFGNVGTYLVHLNLVVASMTHVVAAFTNISNLSNISWSNIPPVTTSNVQWIPIGATAPVNVTPPEQAGILNGIAARTNDLNVKKNIKIGQVRALTTIPAVITYDVTSGW